MGSEVRAREGGEEVQNKKTHTPMEVRKQGIGGDVRGGYRENKGYKKKRGGFCRMILSLTVLSSPFKKPSKKKKNVLIIPRGHLMDMRGKRS